MRRSRLLLFTPFAVLAALSACRKEEAGDQQSAPAAAPAAAPTAPAPAGEGRRIEIAVDTKGYHPASAPAKGGEKLVLVFTRKVDSECVREVIVDGKTTELPLDKPVAIPVTMPADGDLVFTCGMKMFEGRVAFAK